MWVYSSEYEGHPTFRLLPVDSRCPYTEILFDFNKQLLVVIDNNKKFGEVIVNKIADSGKELSKKEKVIVENYQEHYITDKEEIVRFVKRLSVNDFDFTKYIKN